MKLLFVLPILLSLLIPYQSASSNGESSPLTVVNFKWSKTRRKIETGWSLAEVKASYDRVLREPWVPGMCKGL